MAHESNIRTKCKNPFNLSFKPRVDVDVRLDPSTSSLKTREIITLCNKDLDDYDAESFRLLNQIAHVQTQKNRLREYKKQLQSFFFRQLPNEILCTIFEMTCMENLLQQYPWPSSSEQPATCFSLPAIAYLPALAIGAVCTRWRSLALVSPRLWSQLRLETGCTEEALDDSSYDGFVSTLRLYLDRSVNAPLSINVVTQGTNSHLEDHISAVFDLLLDHTDRWKSFSYTGDYELDVLIDYNLSFPILENLTIKGNQGEIIPSDLKLFQHVPKLLTVAIGFGLQISVAALPRSWNHLTSLRSLYTLDEEDICSLQGYPNLTDLELLGSLSELKMGVTLAKLESFKFVETLGGQDQDLLSDMFSSMTLPSLTEMVIDSENDNHSGLIWPPDAFSAFISRSTCILTTLSLRLVSISDQSLIAAFRILPSLVKFDIDDCLGSWTYSPTASPLTSHFISCMHVSSSTPILPKLRSLSITSHNPSFDDAAFVDMVFSRWLPGSGTPKAVTGIDCLRSLVLCLSTRQIDDEVYIPLEYLESMGMQVVVIHAAVTGELCLKQYQ